MITWLSVFLNSHQGKTSFLASVQTTGPDLGRSFFVELIFLRGYAMLYPNYDNRFSFDQSSGSGLSCQNTL